MIWVFVLDMPGPVPMIPMILVSSCFLAISITVCLIFPKDWRQEPAFASQLKWLILSQLYTATHMLLCFIFFNFVFFTTMPLYLQWLAAIALPAIRELSRHIRNFICR